MDASLAGGGAVIGLGWHTIDLIMYLIPKVLLTVDGRVTDDQAESVERHGSALFGFEGGVTATVTANHLAPKNAVYERLYLAASNGTVILDRTKPKRDLQQPSILHQQVDGSLHKPDMSNTLARKWAPTAAFLDNLLKRRISQAGFSVKPLPILSSGSDSLRTVEAVERFYSSAAAYRERSKGR